MCVCCAPNATLVRTSVRCEPWLFGDAEASGETTCSQPVFKRGLSIQSRACPSLCLCRTSLGRMSAVTLSLRSVGYTDGDHPSCEKETRDHQNFPRPWFIVIVHFFLWGFPTSLTSWLQKAIVNGNGVHLTFAFAEGSLVTTRHFEVRFPRSPSLHKG
jgi:hypothetical protein